jgi:hypothetical protein
MREAMKMAYNSMFKEDVYSAGEDLWTKPVDNGFGRKDYATPKNSASGSIDPLKQALHLNGIAYNDPAQGIYALVSIDRLALPGADKLDGAKVLVPLAEFVEYEAALPLGVKAGGRSIGSKAVAPELRSLPVVNRGGLETLITYSK